MAFPGCARAALVLLSRLAPALLIVFGLESARSVASAGSFSGSLSSSVYLYERADSTGRGTAHARARQWVRLAHVRGALAFRLHGRLEDDLRTRNAEDPGLRISGLTAEWRSGRSGPALRFGRQTVFAGGAPATIDGARLDFGVPRASWLRARIVGGALSPAGRELELISDPGRNWQIGGRIDARPHSGLSIAAGWVERRRLRPGFTTERADSLGNVFERIVEPADRAMSRGSLDASWTANARATVRGRADWSRLHRRLARAEMSLRADVGRAVSVDGGYTFRSPQIPATSIFSVFDADPSHETEVGVTGRVRRMRLRGTGAVIVRAGDVAYRTSASVHAAVATLGYTRRGGYAGEVDGVSLGLHRSFGDGRVVSRLQGSWASSRPDPDHGDRETLWAGVAGVSVRPRHDLRLDGEMQVLRNRWYDRDLRFLLRLHWRFFRRTSQPAAAEPGGAE